MDDMTLDDRIRVAYDDCWPITEMAESFAVSTHFIEVAMTRLGLPKRLRDFHEAGQLTAAKMKFRAMHQAIQREVVS
jgi:hypothetical protein